MKLLLRILAWFVAGIAALLVVVYGALWAVNGRDRPASPAALRMEALRAEMAAVPDRDNGFVFAMGFAAPKNEDAYKTGMARVAWIRETAAHADARAAADPAPESYDVEAQRNAATKKTFELCRRGNAACAAALARNEDALADWLQAHRWLQARYRRLLVFPQWSENVPPDYRMPLPPYPAILEAQRMQLVEAWRLAGHGNAAGARALLDADVRFWRRALGSSGTVVGKTIAAAALANNFAWGNLILRRLAPGRAAEGIPAPWLQPFSADELAVHRMLSGEWESLRLMLAEIKSGTGVLPGNEGSSLSIVDRLLWRVLSPFIQVQDGSNRCAGDFLQAADALHVPPDRFARALEEARRLETSSTAAYVSGHAYNFVGNFFLGIARPGFASYAARYYDLEGVRRAVLLAALLRGDGVAPAQLPLRLANSALRNPYTGTAFGWDAAAGAIVFDGLAGNERGHHPFLY